MNYSYTVDAQKPGFVRARVPDKNGLFKFRTMRLSMFQKNYSSKMVTAKALCTESSDDHAMYDLRKLFRTAGVGTKQELCRQNVVSPTSRIQVPEVPSFFRDVATMELMNDPVSLGPHTVDRSTAEQLRVENQYQNPLDRRYYAEVYPNLALREAIQAWKIRTGYFDEIPDENVQQNPPEVVGSRGVFENGVYYEPTDDDIVSEFEQRYQENPATDPDTEPGGDDDDMMMDNTRTHYWESLHEIPTHMLDTSNRITFQRITDDAATTSGSLVFYGRHTRIALGWYPLGREGSPVVVVRQYFPDLANVIPQLREVLAWDVDPNMYAVAEPRYATILLLCLVPTMVSGYHGREVLRVVFYPDVFLLMSDTLTYRKHLPHDHEQFSLQNTIGFLLVVLESFETLVERTDPIRRVLLEACMHLRNMLPLPTTGSNDV
jgi:hypothetical protein